MKAKTLERIKKLENDVLTMKLKQQDTLELLNQIRDYMCTKYFDTPDGKAECDRLLEGLDFDK
jgi:hypothetical protein